MPEIVRLDRPHNRYSDLEVHFKIAAAVDRHDVREWVRCMSIVSYRQNWRHRLSPAQVLVTKAFYRAVWVASAEYADALGSDLTFRDGEAYFRDVPIVPVED